MPSSRAADTAKATEFSRNGNTANRAKVMLPTGPPRKVWPTISTDCSLPLAPSSRSRGTTDGMSTFAALSATVSAAPTSNAAR
jgi:hypothetical protein